MKKLATSFIAFLFCAGFSLAQGPKTGVNIGNKVPELIGESVDGTTIKLSDTRGKLVLLNFWASWCGSCRKENPAIADAYRKFKDKKFKNGNGFTVFSVSLDRTKAAWKYAIAYDKLTWPCHICDFSSWQSKHAAIYGVSGIPTNFLIDGDGVIVARNLRGPALKAALIKYVK